MLMIRLQRTGRRGDPSFRLVVTEHARSATAGKFVERVGTYNPKSKERSLNAERITYWLSVGAKATPTVHNMLISAGVIKGKKINVLPRMSAPQKEGGQQTGDNTQQDATGIAEAKEATIAA